MDINAHFKFYIISAYCIFTICTIVTESLLTKKFMKFVKNSLISDLTTMAAYTNQMLCTKLLMLLEISYAADFYFNKDINSLVQIFIVKLINGMVWLNLGNKINTDIDFAIHIIITFISMCLIFCSLYFEYSSIYKYYNRHISYDPKIISVYLFLRIVNAVQNATKVFLVIRSIISIHIRYCDFYTFYSFIKFLAIIIIETYDKREKNIYNKVRAYTTSYFLLFMFGVVYMIATLKNETVKFHFISFNFEILTLFSFILLVCCTVKMRKNY